MEREVLEANGAFYSAFVRRDLRAMGELWAQESPVACIHPGWEPLRGREAVLQSLRAIFTGGGAPASITCYGPTVHALGDDAAYVVCTERVPGGALAATNLFVREDGRWKLAHHQAAPIAQRNLPKPPPKAPQGPMN